MIDEACLDSARLCKGGEDQRRKRLSYHVVQVKLKGHEKVSGAVADVIATYR